MKSSLLVLTADDVAGLLENRTAAVLDCIEQCYREHGRGKTVVPFSSFLRFPGRQKERVIALPAYVGGEPGRAGIKWVASFPGNLAHGKPRATATIVLNSAEDGYPICLLEGSLISATRTAASAALAARWLHEEDCKAAGFIGCGPINWEIFRFLNEIFPDLGRVMLYDHVESASRAFAARVKAKWPDVAAEILPGYREVLSSCALASFATTSIEPYVGSADLPARGTILHVSLRDICPEGILKSRNIVDDVEHVCREGTSIALASGSTGGQWKPNMTLCDFIEGRRRAAELAGRVAIFSPFGLGALDVALASLVYDAARENGTGTFVENFVG